ncbi:hypothetical protein J18TS1_17090 [Oceanobacillus oncorhynchi subsp. incaldanensis]|uniref:Uncharacterized protein n=2 Tax=Oceanobacillus TaxID=182709 RepID=A0A0A1MSD0_9BACI|nr:hypothetical protein [Oceanobacillus oncorhynchi]MDM8099922.1 hypothetical protein [Oceanobacillus oncorhynchi]UUI40460.1 hypothetical protein NP440_02415 [Oceanobacillus oncorhynchi]GIO18609.1 hypothetical protein J18TS1_17090 [Oceanobacillus oncorhynchi subsp. incaldanensis]CEI81881.1 hypothetical protein BN997_01736 [Oceanobacillus oncorhynchi]
MLKDEFNEEDKLKEELDRFQVIVPEQKRRQKQTAWQRFIHYLASPAKDPLEKATVTLTGLNLTRMVPLALGVGMSVIQLWIHM